MAKRVAVIDSKACNLDSIRRALEECGAEPIVTRDPAQIDSADRLVLPGVGNFKAVMKNLDDAGLSDAVREAMARRPRPLLGICLGMQLLAQRSTEGQGVTAGLGLIEGEVVRLEPKLPREPVPHVGWNSIQKTGAAALFEEIPDGTDFYFVHSFHLQAPEDVVAAKTDYCGGIVSAIAKPPVYGVQFHPEKSQRAGFRLLRNFLAV